MMTNTNGSFNEIQQLTSDDTGYGYGITFSGDAATLVVGAYGARTGHIYQLK